MLEVSDNQKKASRIVERFRIIEIMRELCDYWFNFESSQGLAIYRNVASKGLENVETGVILSSGDDEIVIGLSEFRSSYVPDDDDTSYGDAFVYFNGGLVFQTTANKQYHEYGSSLDIRGDAFHIDVFKAGPWLELLGEWYQEAKKAGEERTKAAEDEERRQREEKEKSDFDFGDYDAAKLKPEPHSDTPRQKQLPDTVLPDAPLNPFPSKRRRWLDYWPILVVIAIFILINLAND